MKGTAVHIIPQTTEAPKPNVGAAMAVLLPQLPAELRDQVRDAWSADLEFMFTTGMDAGERIVWDAFEDAGVTNQKKKPAATQSRPALRMILGGAL